VRYLITGATGFIGPYLVDRLLSEGHFCRCLVRGNINIGHLQRPGVELVRGDITKPETLAGMAEGIDRVLHMATLGHMSNFTVTEEMFEAINVTGTVNVMQEALRAGAPRVLHCSTVAAMGICQDNPATEESPCTPHHAYGRSKLKAEQLVKQLVSEKGLPAVIVRFSMVYGPGDPRDILKLTRLARKGLFPRIGNRTKLTPLIHAKDAVSSMLLAAEKGRIGEIYLLTNRESLPFDEIRKILMRALGISRPALYVPEWAALAVASGVEKLYGFIGKAPIVSRKNIESTLADRVFSIQKAEDELGFYPRVDPVHGLTETVRWYRKQGWV
jgi:dihydroflavonol-4-reductase